MLIVSDQRVDKRRNWPEAAAPEADGVTPCNSLRLSEDRQDIANIY